MILAEEALEQVKSKINKDIKTISDRSGEIKEVIWKAILEAIEKRKTETHVKLDNIDFVAEILKQNDSLDGSSSKANYFILWLRDSPEEIFGEFRRAGYNISTSRTSIYGYDINWGKPDKMHFNSEEDSDSSGFIWGQD
jgi:hypothetical protein